MKYSIFYCFCLNLLLVQACSTQKNKTTNDGNSNQEMPIKTDEILFINLKMEAENGDKKAVTLINTVKSTGKLKTASPQFSPNQNSTYLTLSLLNSQKKKVNDMTIEHPLMRDVESFAENGSIQQNSLNIPSAEFSIRIQNTQDVRYIVIKEVIKGKIGQQSFTINL
jgi:hypothetical protein